MCSTTLLVTFNDTSQVQVARKQLLQPEETIIDEGINVKTDDRSLLELPKLTRPIYNSAAHRLHNIICLSLCLKVMLLNLSTQSLAS